MQKNKARKLVMATAVAALLAGTAGQASAFENEFHFSYLARSIASNFDVGNGKALGQDAGATVSQAHDPKTLFFVEQLGRLNYTGKANENLKLVSMFQVDFIFGDGMYNEDSLTNNVVSGSDRGGGLGGDAVNFKTKVLYADYRLDQAPLHFKFGLQPYTDPYKGTVLSNVAAGLTVASEHDNWQATGGWFRLHSVVNPIRYGDAGVPVENDRSDDFFLLDGNLKVSETLKLGASYYLWNSNWKNPQTVAQNTDNIQLHYLGVNAEGKIGPVFWDGFLIGSFGQRFDAAIGKKQDVSSFETAASVRVPVSPGQIRSTFIYTSGAKNINGSSRHDFTGVINSDGVPENYFWSPEMLMLLMNKYAVINNRNVIHSVNNEGAGTIAGFIGYDHDFTKNLFGSVNAGFAAVAQNTLKRHGDYLGTELNGQVGYKLNTNATLILQGGYVFLGDNFKGLAAEGNGSDPADPWTARLVMSFTY
jgi:hypothetical protein